MHRVDQPTLGEWLQEEPFSLAMSSGFFGFFAHAGVVDALFHHDLHPSRLYGSSAGGFIAGLLASGMEPMEMHRSLMSVERADFWDPAIGKGLLKGELFDRLLRHMMPITNFEEAVVPAAISVFDVRKRQTEVLEKGDIALAIRATCAFPGLFQPVYIEGQPKLDGGIKDHSGLAGIKKGERTLHINLAKDPLNKVHGENLTSLYLSDLPAVNPFRLKRGVDAYKQAFIRVNIFIDTPVAGH